MTPGLGAVAASPAEGVRGLGLLGGGVGGGLAGLGSSASPVAAAAEDGWGVCGEPVGPGFAGVRSEPSSWVSSSDFEANAVSFCLLERWLVNLSVLLSAAVSETLLESSSSSAGWVSRYSLYLRTGISMEEDKIGAKIL